MNTKLTLGILVFLASIFTIFGQVGDVVVDGNGTVTEPTNLWEANAAGISSALELGTASQSNTEDFTTIDPPAFSIGGSWITAPLLVLAPPVNACMAGATGDDLDSGKWLQDFFMPNLRA